MEKDDDSFYVCFYKEDDSYIAHAFSNKPDFEKNIDEVKRKYEEEKSTNETNNETELHLLHEDFIRSIIGYIELLPVIAAVAPMLSSSIRQRNLVNFLEGRSSEIDAEEGRTVYRVPLEHYRAYSQIDAIGRNAHLVGKQVPKMLIIGVVSSYEYHSTRLIRAVLRKYPTMIEASDKQISVKDVFSSGNLEDFKDNIVEKEIENVMRGSLSDQISWFERALSLKSPISTGYDKWADLVEIFERRNLFAHTNGVVNSIYLSKMKHVGNMRCAESEPGEELLAGPKYFKASIENLCEFGVKLTQVVWRKLYSTEAAVADDLLGNFSFDLIERGEYRLAARLLKFSLELSGKKDGKRRKMDVVNLANSYKLMGDKQSCVDTLEMEDWSAVSDDFNVAVSAVKDDVSAVVSAMNKLKHSEEWDARYYEEWPVFFGVRESPEFHQEFSKIYGREFSPIPKKKFSLDAIRSVVSNDDLEDTKEPKLPKTIN
jgi:hypothetical protein